jgi:hypothetical protein
MQQIRYDFTLDNYVDRATYFDADAQHTLLGAGYVYPSDYTATVPDELKAYVSNVNTDGVRNDVIGYLCADGIVERVARCSVPIRSSYLPK